MSNEMLLVNAVDEMGALGTASKIGGNGGGGGAANGIPSGGSAGDLLIKASSTDYDATWFDLSVVRFAAQSLTDGEKAQARSNIGAGDAIAVRVTKDSVSTNVTVTPEAGYRYEYEELASLTISSPPATGEYSIIFTSGSTATTTTIPNTILGLESFAASANTLYEINVLDNRAVVGSWAVSS